MKKLMVVLLILTLGLSLVLTSCGQSASGGSVFNWNVGADQRQSTQDLTVRVTVEMLSTKLTKVL